MAQGCSLSPIWFSVFIYDLLIEVEKAGLGVQLNNGKKIGKCSEELPTSPFH